MRVPAENLILGEGELRKPVSLRLGPGAHPPHIRVRDASSSELALEKMCKQLVSTLKAFARVISASSQS